MRKKVDHRIRDLVENGVRLGHRSLIVMVGDKGREQVVNLHYLMSKCSVKQRPRVLWCYKKDLGFSSHHRKRMRQIKRDIKRGLRDPDADDPFELFITCTDIRFCYYRDTQTILGNTFGMCILQDFEALTPNLMARTIETVEGGGIVMVLLKSMRSLKQLFTMAMDVHERFRTEGKDDVVGRFTERMILSLSSCSQCLVMDDELNVLPISSHALKIKPIDVSGDNHDAVLSESQLGLVELKKSVKDTQPVGSLVEQTRTLDQAKAVMTCVDAISDKVLRGVVSITAARGRGKSSALGLAIAGAIAYGYANVFVTAPSPENLRSLFEMVFKGFDAVQYKEHIDYEIVQSTDPELKNTVVRVNIFREHRQTIQYIHPGDWQRLAQAELVVIDEAAAIPLPIVKRLLGPYLVVMSSTINGYEGTGRSLSLKLLKQLRQQAASSGSSGFTALREVELKEPIRYTQGDPVEDWLNSLLCLDCCTASNRIVTGTPHPSACELYHVNRDTLFSYHRASEDFLRKLMNLMVSSHYKNTPNDLQLMSDAPGHHLFVLLGPVSADTTTLPDILCVLHVALEGEISKVSIMRSLGRGVREAGNLIPWTVSQQFQDHDFGGLSGARIVRIATHPDLQKMGYGTRAIELLCAYYDGKMAKLSDNEIGSGKPSLRTTINTTDNNESTLQTEHLVPRSDLPPLLSELSERPAELLHWIGTSYGMTESLYNFWQRNSFSPIYLRQTANETTGEYTCIMLRALEGNGLTTMVNANWLEGFCSDFQRRIVSLLSQSFRELPVKLALSLVYGGKKDISTLDTLSSSDVVFTIKDLRRLFLEYDIRRLESYSRNLVDYHLILDLLPQIARLIFLKELAIPLSAVQAALLLGLGLQHKRFEQLHDELGLQVNQLLALFQKVLRKVSTSFRSLEEDDIKQSMPAAQERMMPALKQSLDTDLNQAAGEAISVLKEKQTALLTSIDLDEYAITGTEEAWASAGASALRGGKPGIVSIEKNGSGGGVPVKRMNTTNHDDGNTSKKNKKSHKNEKRHSTKHKSKK